MTSTIKVDKSKPLAVVCTCKQIPDGRKRFFEVGTMTSGNVSKSVKTAVQHSCGHRVVVYLTGTDAVCRRKLARLQPEPCNECLPMPAADRKRLYRESARVDSEHEAWRARYPQRSETWD